MPSFERLAEQRGGVVATATICVVEPGDNLAVSSLPASTKFSGYKWNQTVSTALSEIGVDGLPALLVFDRTGTAVYSLASSELEGELSAAEMTDAIDAVVRAF
jgi:hypothetical protein